ncbi:MAG: glutaredoxin family protein [Fervidicoccaceae archaeon]|jgi:glutaredoxin|uniref:Glutaredoxin domain-containing protein n=1 Tax=Fervidicoccus fontis TaxID=683846 RepID=A0A7C2UJF4_9CREN|nr:MAG: hypothetical protein C0179_07860 [Fervidicoccus sp.]HEU97748.1 hypothetical protein [Fervidicoccus fontis]
MLSRKKNKRLLVYGMEGCIPCERAISYLKELGIEFDYVDIEKNSDARLDVEIIEGGDLLLPLIVEPVSEQIAIGCPVEMEKFKKEIWRILSP